MSLSHGCPHFLEVWEYKQLFRTSSNGLDQLRLEQTVLQVRSCQAMNVFIGQYHHLKLYPETISAGLTKLILCALINV